MDFLFPINKLSLTEKDKTGKLQVIQRRLRFGAAILRHQSILLGQVGF